MHPEQSIPEETFLLTELRYTLGQLHVQIGDLDDSALSNETGGQSIDSLLAQLIDNEKQYQAQYARVLNVAAPAHPDDQPIPLPVEHQADEMTKRARFEHMRAATVAMLEGAGASWPAGLREAVREQVQADRNVTTQIANRRQQIFEEPQRPDLDQPITDHPEPHVEAAQASEQS
jgi:hypothetical protein